MIKPAREVTATGPIRGSGRVLLCLIALLGALRTGWAAAIPLPASELKPEPVIILSSYHPGHSWADAEITGILAAMGSNTPPIVPPVFHLGMLSYRRASELTIESLDLLRSRVVSNSVRVIVACDTPALRFAIESRDAMFPHANVVFVGVEEYPDIQESPLPWVTGAIEDFDVAANVELIRRLQPALGRILMISDRSHGNNTARRRLAVAYGEAFVQQQIVSAVRPGASRLLDLVSALGPDDAILLTGSDQPVSVVDHLAREGRTPVYGMISPRLLNCVVGGVMTDGQMDGVLAGQIALKVLAGRAPSEVPIVTKAPRRTVVNHELMQRYGLSFASLPAGTEIINQPIPIWRRHPQTMTTVFVSFGVVLTTALILAWSQRQKRRAESRLHATSERLRLLIEHSGALVFEIDAEQRIVYSSANAALILGRDAGELTGRPFCELVHPDDRTKAAQLLDNEAAEQVLRWPRAGAWGWFECHLRQFTEADAGTRRVLALRDVTARVEMERTLQANEERHRSVIESLAEGIVLQTPDGQIIACNHSATTILGLSEEQLLGRKTIDESWRTIHEDGSVFPPEDYPVMQTARTGEPQTDVVMGVHTAAGRLSWIAINTRVAARGPDGRPAAVVASFVSISARKQAEAALRSSEERLRTLLSTLPDAVFIFDADGRYLEVFGQPRGDAYRDVQHFKGHRLHDKLPREAADGALLIIRQTIRDGLSQTLEYNLDFEGDSRWFEGRTAPIRLDDHDTRGALWIAREITARKRAETSLLQLNSLLGATFNATADGILVDRGGRVASCNRKFLELWSVPEGRVIGRPLLELMRDLSGQVSQPREFFTWAEDLTRQQELTALDTLTFPDGRCFERYAEPQRIENSVVGRVWSFRDVTRQRRAEDQLRALTANLDSIREEERARIAHEVHDELGQTLTGLKMDLARLGNQLPDGDTHLRDRVASMLSLVDSTVQTVRRIATELRPGVLDNFGLIAALEWLASEFTRRTGVPCQFDCAEEFIALDDRRLTAVFRICQESFTNIARHAQARRVHLELYREGGEIVMRIKDDGRGFEPAPPGSDQSFGILGMRERARRVGGILALESVPGRGTTIELRLPTESPATRPPGALPGART